MGTRDDNRRVVAMAVDPNGVATPLSIDHSTGYVNVSILGGDGTPSATYMEKRDNNSIPVASAVNPSGAIKNILIDSSNNGIRVVVN